MALRAIWQFIDRDVAHKILYGPKRSWVPYTILWVTDRSINCHLARSAMNYLLYYTQYMQICQTTCFCYCIPKTKNEFGPKSGRKHYIDRARSIYSLTCLTCHLCLTVTLRPVQLMLLYNLTLFKGHLSNTANGHLFHAWIVRSSSNNGHFGHLITWHNVYDRSCDTVTFKIINNCRREIQLIELVI